MPGTCWRRSSLSSCRTSSESSFPSPGFAPIAVRRSRDMSMPLRSRTSLPPPLVRVAGAKRRRPRPTRHRFGDGPGFGHLSGVLRRATGSAPVRGEGAPGMGLRRSGTRRSDRDKRAGERRGPPRALPVFGAGASRAIGSANLGSRCEPGRAEVASWRAAGAFGARAASCLRARRRLGLRIHGPSGKDSLGVAPGGKVRPGEAPGIDHVASDGADRKELRCHPATCIGAPALGPPRTHGLACSLGRRLASAGSRFQRDLAVGPQFFADTVDQRAMRPDRAHEVRTRRGHRCSIPPSRGRQMIAACYLLALGAPNKGPATRRTSTRS